jgi:hypothetical protein
MIGLLTSRNFIIPLFLTELALFGGFRFVLRNNMFYGVILVIPMSE